MKKVMFFIASVLMLVSMTSCYRAKPDGGQECVLVKKPMFFGYEGVVAEAVSTGSEWCVFTTKDYYFSIQPVTITENFEDMIPADNTPVSFSVYLKVQNQAGKTPILYEKFGAEWYANSIRPTFRTMVRDKACVYNMFDLASKRDISANLEKQIFTDIDLYFKQLNIPVTVLGVSIGAVTPPKPVLDETKLTAAQNQSVLTQQARAKAELARKDAEVNKAIADRAYQVQMGMTVNEYLHLRALEIEKEKVELIKDHDNATIIFGSGGGIPTTYPVK
jgi:hypothetical protein